MFSITDEQLKTAREKMEAYVTARQDAIKKTQDSHDAAQVAADANLAASRAKLDESGANSAAGFAFIDWKSYFESLFLVPPSQ